MKSLVSFVTMSGVLVSAISFVVVGCSSNPPANQPNQYNNGNGNAPYGSQPYGAQPGPTATAAPPVAATTGLAPSPLAPACQQLEGTCGFARCNLQAQRCAFPCNSNNDCITGSSCLGAGTPMGVCTPSLTGGQ